MTAMTRNRSADRIVGLCFLILVLVEFVFIGAPPDEGQDDVSWLEFTGRIGNALRGQPVIHADVELRGEPVGTLELDLDQWDDLRGMVYKRGLRWLNVTANDSKVKARG